MIIFTMGTMGANFKTLLVFFEAIKCKTPKAIKGPDSASMTIAQASFDKKRVWTNWRDSEITRTIGMSLKFCMMKLIWNYSYFYCQNLINEPL